MRVANAPLPPVGAATQRVREDASRVGREAAATGQAVGELIRVDERVLDDLSHELGNFFHKLYYWSDYIKSGADDLGPDSSASHMLDRTIHNLEAFLKVAMDYFQPVRLSCMRMSGADVVGSLEVMLREEAEGERIEMTGVDAARDTSLMIDPHLFSNAVRMVIRQVRSIGPSGTPLFGLRADVRRAARSEAPGLEIEIGSPAGGAAGSPRKGAHVLEWAVARKFIEMHGGEISAHEQQGTAKCVLFLPLCG